LDGRIAGGAGAVETARKRARTERSAPEHRRQDGVEHDVGLFRSIQQFFGEVRGEFARVSWPTREATLTSTGVVVFVTIVIAVYLGLIDLGLSRALKMIIG
jgi:preprotein translocase subunit SecE